jgi:hypothetical protein
MTPHQRYVPESLAPSYTCWGEPAVREDPSDSQKGKCNEDSVDEGVGVEQGRWLQPRPKRLYL